MTKILKNFCCVNEYNKIIETTNENKAEEIINTANTDLVSVTLEVITENTDSVITIYKENKRWFAILENVINCKPIEIVDITDITDKTIWYALITKNSELRHIIFFLMKEERESGIYNINRQVAKKIAA